MHAFHQINAADIQGHVGQAEAGGGSGRAHARLPIALISSVTAAQAAPMRRISTRSQRPPVARSSAAAKAQAIICVGARNGAQ